MYNATGMSCAACQAHVEKAVSKVNGVMDVNVNLLANKMTVDLDEGVTNAQSVINAVESAGRSFLSSSNTSLSKSFANITPLMLSALSQ